MPRRDFAKVSILLYDPVPSNVAPLRGALYDMGVRDIEIVNTPKLVKQKVLSGAFDLMFGEVSHAEDDLIKLVASLRAGELGKNPFMPVIGSTGRLGAQLVRAVVNAGFDDIMGRPFSYAMIWQRIESVVDARKPFVVTSDYVGPDRRTILRPGQAAPRYFEAPNVLRAKIEGDRQALREQQGSILVLAEEMWRERLSRVAIRVASIADDIVAASRAAIEIAERMEMTGDLGYEDEEEDPRPAELVRFSQDLYRFARSAGNEQAVAIAVAIIELANRLAARDVKDMANDAAAVVELSNAVQAVMDPDFDDEQGVLDKVRAAAETAGASAA